MNVTETIQEALAAALKEWKPGADTPSLTALRRYALRSRLDGHRVGELKAALTIEEMFAERNRVGRALVKADYIELLVTRTLRAHVRKPVQG